MYSQSGNGCEKKTFVTGEGVGRRGCSPLNFELLGMFYSQHSHEMAFLQF